MHLSAKHTEFFTTLGYTFQDENHLVRATEHPSAPRARGGFERYEFLGDRVLGLCLATLLLQRHPDEAEGDLAKRFAKLASRPVVSEVAENLGLDVLLKVGGEEWQQTSAATRLRADACEALLGAIFLDGGFEKAFQCVARHWAAYFLHDEHPPMDAKTVVQEWAQARALPSPSYRVLSTQGPDHAPTFLVAVTLASWYAEGEGGNKKQAEQAAAANLKDILLQNSLASEGRGPHESV